MTLLDRLLLDTFATENFEELICRVIHWARSLNGDWKEQVCRFRVPEYYFLKSRYSVPRVGQKIKYK